MGPGPLFLKVSNLRNPIDMSKGANAHSLNLTKKSFIVQGTCILFFLQVYILLQIQCIYVSFIARMYTFVKILRMNLKFRVKIYKSQKKPKELRLSCSEWSSPRRSPGVFKTPMGKNLQRSNDKRRLFIEVGEKIICLGWMCLTRSWQKLVMGMVDF